MRNQQVLKESIAVFFIEQLISAIEYIHYKGYAHLDIKLDNILLDDYFNIRLSDFGSSLKIDDQPFTEFRRGTPKYMAPEVFNLTEGENFNAYKADIYSLAVCLFLMLFKKFPVYEEGDYPETRDLFTKPEILDTCPFDCDKSRWASLSTEVRRILVACLNKDPDQRPYSHELVESFLLPPQKESIEELVFEEMQTRKGKYEQMKHEKDMKEQNFVIPAPCKVPQCDGENCKDRKSRPASRESGSNPNLTTVSRN